MTQRQPPSSPTWEEQRREIEKRLEDFLDGKEKSLSVQHLRACLAEIDRLTQNVETWKVLHDTEQSNHKRTWQELRRAEREALRKGESGK